MSESTRTYLPAAGYDWSLPLYDPIVKLLGGDKARMVLLDHAALRPGYRVLDIGCGTGTLATLIKRFHPDVEVVGIDPDPKAVRRVLKPGGGFHMLDFEGPESGSHGVLAHLLHSSKRFEREFREPSLEPYDAVWLCRFPEGRAD